MSSSTTPSAQGARFADFDEFDESIPLSAPEASTAWLVFGGTAALLLLAYWDMLVYTSSYWSKGLYSHGWIVPLIAGYLFWIRRKPLVEASPSERWLGVGLIGLFLAVRVWASIYDYNIPDRLSFLGCLLGLCLVVGGQSLLRWAGPTVLFLIFMFPLPAKLENTFLMKLQTGASIASTWVLQLLGVGAVRDGNSISILSLDKPLEVAEACSGLRMLTIFGAFTIAFVMTMNRPWWDKLAILVLGWIPIALVSNVIRIVTTGLLFLFFGQETEWLSAIIHNWAGYAMMPIGLGILWVQMAILERITTPIDDDQFADFGAPAGRGAALAT